MCQVLIHELNMSNLHSHLCSFYGCHITTRTPADNYDVRIASCKKGQITGSNPHFMSRLFLIKCIIITVSRKFPELSQTDSC